MSITIVFFILLIILDILAAISGFIMVGFSTIMYLAIYYLFIICAFSLFLLIVINAFQKKFNFVHVIILGFFLINIGGYYYLYNLERGYNEVNSYMKETYDNYEIVGINKVGLHERINGDAYGNFADCKYVFDVKLNDNKNITFQSAYCSLPSFMTYYNVTDSYDNNYLKYYFDEYMKNNNTSLRLETSKYYFLHDQLKIHFNNNNYEEIEDFIKYLESNDKHKYSIIFVNDSNDKNYIYYNNDHIFEEIYTDINRKK